MLYGRTFGVCCDAVHKVLSTMTDYVCENIPDKFEAVYLSTKSRRMKRKRTGKYHYKLTRYYQLKFTEGRNRRGWNKPWKKPKQKDNYRLAFLGHHT